jgi:hypothetical protein
VAAGRQLDILDEVAEATHPDDASVLRTGIEHLAALGRHFTADDLWTLNVPMPAHPNQVGAAFSAARKQGVITSVGYAPSTRKGRNGSVVRVWVGVAA